MNIDIRQGDVLDVLRTMPTESVHCVITSPPYFGLRDYGTALWDGGDAGCQHKPDREARTGRARGSLTGGMDYVAAQEPTYKQVCGKCGATRIDKQIGLEDTPDAYLQRMVEVFREVRRVLRSDGTCWVNMGDSYAHNGACGGSSPDGPRKPRATDREKQEKMKYRVPDGLKPKDLLMMPARLALALQADGWWLRSDIIWCKRAPMPESVTDRPTSAHEHIFLLTKAARYFYDADAVREPHTAANIQQQLAPNTDRGESRQFRKQGLHDYLNPMGRNQWNYWLLSPESFPDAHFATFPTEIPRRCIKAGTSEHGVCSECGAPYRRVVERTNEAGETAIVMGGDRFGRTVAGDYLTGDNRHKRPDVVHASGTLSRAPSDAGHTARTTGWAPTCAHTSAPVVPATVLDIFNGSGTTGLVALELGRHYIGIELNPQYVELTRKRLMSEMPLFAYQALEGAA